MSRGPAAWRWKVCEKRPPRGARRYSQSRDSQNGCRSTVPSEEINMYNVLLFAELCITYTPSGMTDLTVRLGGIKRKRPSLLSEEAFNDR